jgi:hypothetical protein
VSYKNKTLLSTIDPIAAADRAAAEQAPAGQDRTLYFCPSPLFGYGLETLLSRLGADSAVVCVETDGELLKLSRSSIGARVLAHPRLILAGPGNGEELRALVRETWGARVFRRVVVLKLSGGWQLDGAAYEELAETLRRDIALDWGNAMTLVKLGRRFAWNSIRNLALLGRSPPLGAASLASRPVLVLGAGPSLDPALDALEAAGLPRGGDRPFALICVDTCLGLLRERGLRADLAVILESQFWNQRDFTGLRGAGVPAAVDLSAYPPTAEILGGPVFVFFTPWTELRLFNRLAPAGLLPPALPPLGSVGLTAVELARRLTRGPVIIAGIDFSFPADRTHARSSPAHLASLLGQNRFHSPVNAAGVFRAGVFTARSKAGLPVKSDPALRTYRDLFERRFAGDPRMGDLPGTGLPLGLNTLETEEAAALLTGGGGRALPGDGVFPAAPAPFSPPAADPAGLERFMAGEERTLEELRRILSGGPGPAGPGGADLEVLLDEADYLWAHFPDCAAAGGRRPPVSDRGFLKRVRAEIDPFLKRWRLSRLHLPPPGV